MPLLTLFAAGSNSWNLLLFLHLLPELLLQPLLAQFPLVSGITLHGQGVRASVLPPTDTKLTRTSAIIFCEEKIH